MSKLPEVTERNTKKEILEAFEAAKTLLSAKNKSTFNPEEIVKEKAKAETIATATKAVENNGTTDVLTSLQDALIGLAKDVQETHKKASDELVTINEAIELKKEELEELFGIEAKAGALAALIQAHTELSERQKSEYAAANVRLSDELIQLKQQIKETEKAHIDKQKEETAAFEKEQERIREEAEYEFNREKQQRHDALNDELIGKRKLFTEEVIELNRRDEEVKKREAFVTELEEKVAEIPALIEQAKTAAAEEAKKKAETSHGFETRAIKAGYEADKKILENRVELLEAALATERKTNEALQAKLETAYASVENVAKASVEGARTESAVKSVLATLNEGKK